MKHLFLLLIMCLPMMLMAQKKVAVYVTSDDPKVDNAEKEIIGDELVSAIVKTRQYKAVERTADFLQQISKEQGYQHSGNVDDDQISALGKQFGVDYVCVAYIIPFRNTHYVHARLIDVETATVQAAVSEVSTLANEDELVTTAGKVAQALIAPDGIYQAPVADNSRKDRYKSAKKATTPMTDKPEGQIVCNSYSERHILGMKEFSYGTTQMDRKAFADFLWKNCPNAYIKYYKGNQITTAGWVLFGVGIAMTVTGSFVGVYAEEITANKYDCIWKGSPSCSFYGKNGREIDDYGKLYDYRNDCRAVGIAVGSIGVTSVLTSIILLPVGHYQYTKKAMDIFNGECAYKRTAACTLNLQSSRDGIGIALTF